MQKIWILFDGFFKQPEGLLIVLRSKTPIVVQPPGVVIVGFRVSRLPAPVPGLLAFGQFDFENRDNLLSDFILELKDVG